MGKQVVQKLIRVRHFAHLNLAEFWEYIQENYRDHDLNVMKKNRALYVNVPKDGEYEGYVIGLLVSYKDEQTQTSLSENKYGKKIIKVSDIKGGMDYNFFIMSKLNGVAIYQYYHNSASDSVLEALLAEIYAKFKTSKINAEYAAIPESLNKTAANKLKVEIRRKWHRNPKVNLIFKKDDLAKVLSQWKQIQKFSYQIEEFKSAGTGWEPLQNLVKSDKHVLTFEPDSPVKTIATVLNSLRQSLYRGKVEGIDEVNAQRTVDLIDISENIAVYDFDDLSKKIDGLELENFSNSHVFKWIMESVKAKHSDFDTPIQDDDE